MTRRFDFPSDAMYTRGYIPNRAHQPLTDREWTILQLIAAGMSNREIAEQLTLSPTTVKWYTKQIFNKLGAHRRTQAVKVASDLHLMESAAPEDNSVPGIPTPLTVLIGCEKEVHEIINLALDYFRRRLTLMRALFTVDNLIRTILGIVGIYEQRGQPDVALELLAILMHHPQYGDPALKPAARVLLTRLQSRLPPEQINTVMEKAKQGQLSSRYLDPHFTVSPELVDRLLELLDEVAKV